MVSCQARDSRVEATPEQPLCYLPSRLQSNGAARFCPPFLSFSSEMNWHFSHLLSCYSTTLLSGQLTDWPVDSRQKIVVQSQDTDNLPSPCLFNTGYENYSVLGSVTTSNHSRQLHKNWSSLLPCSFLSHYSQQDLMARKLLIFSSVCSKASLFLLFFIFGISTVLRLINFYSHYC